MKYFLKIVIIILLLLPISIISIIMFSNGENQYSKNIKINAPIQLVNVLFEDIYNMEIYLKETKEVILIEGADREKNAKYKIISEYEGQEMEMTGTLLKNDLPDSLVMLYEMNGVVNIMTQRHEKITEYETLIINKQEFQIESGFMKLILFLNPKIFQQQTEIYLKAFKNFVEKQQQIKTTN